MAGDEWLVAAGGALDCGRHGAPNYRHGLGQGRCQWGTLEQPWWLSTAPQVSVVVVRGSRVRECGWRGVVVWEVVGGGQALH